VTAPGVRSITPAEAYGARGLTRIIDVREPDELCGDLGCIPGVESAPLATVERAAAAWDPGEPIVLVCRSGGRSGRAAALLARLGFTQVMNMTGGMQAYRAAGLPTERTRVTRP